jgi:hypothetical protein
MAGFHQQHTAILLSFFAWTCVAPAQTGEGGQPETASSSPATPANSSANPPANPEDKRIFGVLPNNRTTENSLPFAPISARRKMTIAYKDSFDWPVYPTAAAFAALYQIENQNPSFGQGMAGYAKRFGTAYGDQMIGNMMTEGIVPSLLHEDPRYFRLGEGTKASRAKYALKQIVVTRTDSGHKTFNFAEVGGNAAAVAITNLWYPDTRTVSDNVEKMGIQLATDAFSNVLKEFWPDVKRYLHKKRQGKAAQTAGLQ